MNKDNRWRKDPSYNFWALNMYEQHKLPDCISIAVRKHTTWPQLSRSSSHNKQVHAINQNVLDSFYTFVREIRGTAGYWKRVLLDLLAKITTLGPPTWFITLSANDLHWPDLMTFLKSDENDKNEHSQVHLVRKNPIMAAHNFVRRWKCLFKHVILNSNRGAVGEVTDYFVRVEFQSRGSPHLHLFLWIKDAPNISTKEGRNMFPYFLDNYVSTQISLESEDSEMNNLVTVLQTHHHTETYWRGKAMCRFHFPRKPSKQTRIKPDINPLTSKSFYEIKRGSSECWVNAYNLTILRAWKANMEIQFVGSIFSIAMYVSSYVGKAEPERLRRAVADVIHTLKSTCNVSKRKQLSKLGTVLLSRREISAQEEHLG